MLESGSNPLASRRIHDFASPRQLHLLLLALSSLQVFDYPELMALFAANTLLAACDPSSSFFGFMGVAWDVAGRDGGKAERPSPESGP